MLKQVQKLMDFIQGEMFCLKTKFAQWYCKKRAEKVKRFDILLWGLIYLNVILQLFLYLAKEFKAKGKCLDIELQVRQDHFLCERNKNLGSVYEVCKKISPSGAKTDKIVSPLKL